MASSRNLSNNDMKFRMLAYVINDTIDFDIDDILDFMQDSNYELYKNVTAYNKRHISFHRTKTVRPEMVEDFLKEYLKEKIHDNQELKDDASEFIDDNLDIFFEVNETDNIVTIDLAYDE